MFFNKILKISKNQHIFSRFRACASFHNGFDSNTSLHSILVYASITFFVCDILVPVFHMNVQFSKCEFAIQDTYTIYKPRHEKTNNVIFEQVGHKPSCTGTEDAGLDAGDFGCRKRK